MADVTKGDRKALGGYTPFGPVGQGKYSRENPSCISIANVAATCAIKAVDNIQYDPGCGRPFTICDYGAADGLSSLRIMNIIIEKIRDKYGKDLPINIIYEDRPTGDFNSIFLALSGELRGPFPSYQESHQNVFAFATGRDFFQQCLPNDTLHFAYTSTAMHYMSKRPCKLQDAIHVVESCDPDAKVRFAAQAAKDWCTILQHRAKELAPGGQMIVCAPAIDELGQYPGRTLPNTQSSVFEYLALPWKDMIQEGLISQDDFAEMSFNSIYRTVDEYTAPLRDHASGLYKAGLRLVTVDTQVSPCPVHTEWINQKNNGVADDSCRKKLAKEATAQLRSWNEWLFVQALNNNRPYEESVALVEKFWERFENLAAKHLDDLHMDNPMVLIWMEKVQGNAE